MLLSKGIKAELTKSLRPCLKPCKHRYANMPIVTTSVDWFCIVNALALTKHSPEHKEQLLISYTNNSAEAWMDKNTAEPEQSTNICQDK